MRRKWDFYRKLGLFPIIIVAGICGWSYYAFVSLLFNVIYGLSAFGCLVSGLLFHISFVLVVLSYYRVVVTDPGTPDWSVLPADVSTDDYQECNMGVVEMLKSQHQDFLQRLAPPPTALQSIRTDDVSEQKEPDFLKFSLLDRFNDRCDSDSDSDENSARRRSAEYAPLQRVGQSNKAKRNVKEAINLWSSCGWSFVEAKRNGQVRYCAKCRVLKPDRTHHCSVCNCCRLKMDHHCPWINNCVGYFNYRYFLGFVVFGSIECGVVFATAVPSLLHLVSHTSPDLINEAITVNHLFLAVVSLVLGIALTAFSAAHLHLTLINETTIESMQTSQILRIPLLEGAAENKQFQFVDWQSSERIWDIGFKQNWVQAMGDVPFYVALLPFPSVMAKSRLSNGHVFCMNKIVCRKIVERMVSEKNIPLSCFPESLLYQLSIGQ